MANAWLLDTDHCIAYLSPRSPVHGRVTARINATPVSALYLSTFTLLELAEGPFHGQTAQSQQSQQAALDAFQARLNHAAVTSRVVLEFGRIRADLRRQGQIIGDMDTGIAATALVYGLTLVTRNTGHFQRVAGLQFEDWSL